MSDDNTQPDIRIAPGDSDICERCRAQGKRICGHCKLATDDGNSKAPAIVEPKLN